jgi:thymidylate synthase ThyX
MHYVDIRCDKATQKEHREVAEECKRVLTNLFPSLFTDSKQ